MVTTEDIHDVISEVIERGSASFKFAWDQANPIERIVLATLAELMDNKNRPITSRQLQRELEERQVTLSLPEIGTALGSFVFKETVVQEDGYKFAVDLLRRYLRENRKLEWVQEELGAEVAKMRNA